MPVPEHPQDQVGGQGSGEVLQGVTAHNAAHGEDLCVVRLESLRHTVNRCSSKEVGAPGVS